MKNKQKQLIKGIMLSTVLGLGWGIAGDISHAAGNESYPIQTIQKWEEKTFYKKGSIVTYKGLQYQANYPIHFFSPDDHDLIVDDAWELFTDWKGNKIYDKDAIVTYKGLQYKSKLPGTGGIAPDKSLRWEKLTDLTHAK
ncbi:hypothetical protein CN553_18200 [Bacillus cereus]|uniref:Uncharacterized protein n=1 Tax=Bacillus cereus TaxID=1396 RepID=A0A9X6YLP4_BACCE|nr:hypothetical protein [Bacillus cereus]PEN93846.1 hypothetical protein CN553_18200 [Bacillus cereus]